MSMSAGLRTIGSEANRVTSRPSAAFMFFSCSRAAAGPEPPGLAARAGDTREAPRTTAVKGNDRNVFMAFILKKKFIGAESRTPAQLADGGPGGFELAEFRRAFQGAVRFDLAGVSDLAVLALIIHREIE